MAYYISMIKDNADIKSILTLPKEETFFGIMGRMQVLLEYFSTVPEYRSFVPFLQTYYIITKEVALRLHANSHYFNDVQALEKLDVYFATLYFNPLREYLETGRASQPWQSYFAYCSQPKGSPFLQMLLGINAHINGDLGRTLIDTQYVEQGDYLRINEILLAKIPEVLTFLAFKRQDLFGAGGLVFKQFIAGEFNRVIVKWRQAAWNNAVKIQIQKLPYEGVLSQTEQIAERLIEIFNQRYNVTKSRANLAVVRTLQVTI